jgi:hypothetical protein
MRAWITFYGAKGGRQSARRPLEILELADGTNRVRFGLNDIPVRASWAEIELLDELPQTDEVGNPILDNAPVRRIG